MTQDTNPDIIADMVGNIGEHLSDIYLGKDNPRRMEFVGRLEEMVRTQLRKEQFALIHSADVDDVVTAREVMADTHECTKSMSPMKVMQALNPKSVEYSPDIVDAGDGLTSIQSDEGHSIVAADTSYWERSFDRLQERASEWAEQTFGPTSLEHKFARVQDEMVEIVAKPDDVVEWSDALLIFLHAAKAQGITANDIMNAGFEKLEVLKRRKYTHDPDTDSWSYRPAEGYTDADLQLTIMKDDLHG